MVDIPQETSQELFAKATPANKALWGGCLSGNLETVLNALSSGADATLGPVKDLPPTPLHMAALKEDRSEIIKTLVQHGASLNKQDDKGLTAAHMAAGRGNVLAIATLVGCGADINLCENSGQTPAHLAATWGKQRVIRALDKYGADLEAKTAGGITPAHLAARDGHLNVLRVLKDLKISLDSVAKNGKKPIDYAKMNGHTKCILLLERKEKELSSLLSEEFWKANEEGDLDGCLEAIEGVGDVNSPGFQDDDEMHSVVHLAATLADLRMLEILKGKGADMNHHSSDGTTPCHSAALTGNVEALALMIEAGADVNRKMLKSGKTPLHKACSKGSLEVVAELVRLKADVNSTDADGYTPAHAAAQQGHLEVLRLLKDSDADFDRRETVTNSTVLELATLSEHGEIVELLEKSK